MNLTTDEFITLRALLNIHIRQLGQMVRHPHASVEDKQRFSRELAECEVLAEKLSRASVDQEVMA